MRIALIILALFCFSCKVRQVEKTSSHTEKDSSRTIVKDSAGTTTVHTIDTSKKVITIKTVDKDSSETTTTIVPDSGITTVNKDGSVTGHIKSVTTHKVSHSSRTKEKSEQQKAGKDSSSTQQSHTTVLDSGHTHLVKDTTSKKTHSDSTVAANFPWKWVLIIIAGLVIIGGLFWKFRKFFGL